MQTNSICFFGQSTRIYLKPRLSFKKVSREVISSSEPTAMFGSTLNLLIFYLLSMLTLNLGGTSGNLALRSSTLPTPQHAIGIEVSSGRYSISESILLRFGGSSLSFIILTLDFCYRPTLVNVYPTLLCNIMTSPSRVACTMRTRSSTTNWFSIYSRNGLERTRLLCSRGARLQVASDFQW